eukprot:6214498-Pleurochrysis_carterae.AAC.2
MAVPKGPNSVPAKERSAQPAPASPSCALGYGSSSQGSKAASAISCAKNDFPDPEGPVKCSTQSTQVDRCARPVYDSTGARLRRSRSCEASKLNKVRPARACIAAELEERQRRDGLSSQDLQLYLLILPILFISASAAAWPGRLVHAAQRTDEAREGWRRCLRVIGSQQRAVASMRGTIKAVQVLDRVKSTEAL